MKWQLVDFYSALQRFNGVREPGLGRQLERHWSEVQHRAWRAVERVTVTVTVTVVTFQVGTSVTRRNAALVAPFSLPFQRFRYAGTKFHWY